VALHPGKTSTKKAPRDAVDRFFLGEAVEIVPIKPKLKAPGT